MDNKIVKGNIGGMINMLSKVKKANGNDVSVFFKDDKNTFIMSHAEIVETPVGIGFVISLLNYGQQIKEGLKH